MDIAPILRHLQRPARLQVYSSPDLAYEVEAKAKEARVGSPAAVYLKTPQPVDVEPVLETSPADVLRELGVATTFLTHSPFTPIAQLWAHIRYCATMRPGAHGFLALTKHAATDVVHHHKVAQSEQLGIGLALVVARAVLRRRHPEFVFQAVDADVALKAGYIEGLADPVMQAPETKKRPDYFLIGRHRKEGRARIHVAVLECKGTHYERADVIKQLGDACLQVRTVAIGRHRMYGLMVASRLSTTGITAHVLDPPGDDGLWEGSEEEFDALLAGVPEELRWQPRTEDEPQAAPPPTPQASRPPDTPPREPAATQVLEPPARYEIPPNRSGWFAQVLTRSTAAAVLAYAGDSSTAAAYTTPRQRGYSTDMFPDLEESWTDTAQSRIRLPQGPVLRGTAHHMPLPSGKTLMIFRGLEARLHRDLADGDLPSYLRKAGRLQRWWRTRRRRAPGDLFSVGPDGTALLIRVLDARRG